MGRMLRWRRESARRTSLTVEPTREEEEEKQHHAQDDGEGNCGRRHDHLLFGARQTTQLRRRVGDVALWALEAYRVAVRHLHRHLDRHIRRANRTSSDFAGDLSLRGKERWRGERVAEARGRGSLAQSNARVRSS